MASDKSIKVDVAVPNFFVSYCHEDDEHCRKLVQRLTALENEQLLEFWFDGRLAAGQDRDKAIDEHLESCDVALLLVSPAYRASAPCQYEKRKALERRDLGSAHVVPVPLWGPLPQELQQIWTVPVLDRPVVDWHPRIRAFDLIEEAVRTLAQGFAASPPASLAPTAADRKELPAILTTETYRAASLDDWQDAFWMLYGDKDKGVPLFDLLLQIVADSTRLAEAVRTDRSVDALPYIPRIFSWLCNFTTKCGTERALADLAVAPRLADVVWHKYPGVCSTCADSHCSCQPMDLALTDAAEKPHERASNVALMRARAQTSRIPRTLDGWERMFADIYRAPHSRLTLTHKVLHFFEEVGELEVELRKADRLQENKMPPSRESTVGPLDFANEIADVFSWLCSVFSHITLQVELAHNFLTAFREVEGPTDEEPRLEIPTISDWIWREFGSPKSGLLCHVCRKAKCECPVVEQRR